MHDPSTVAFEIRRPWPVKREPGGLLGDSKYYPPIITVWHEDPEKDGSDDSCDWFGYKKPLTPKEMAIFDALWRLETLLDNRPHYPDSPEHRAFQPLKDAIRALRVREGWRIHPRWHVWHWRFQVHPLQQFKRWAFSRCCKCGRRFTWGYSPMGPWSGTGPRWFRNEPGVYHHDCTDWRREVSAVSSQAEKNTD